jgi:Zn ribbon nucleic-acid-binding protein
MANRSPLMCPLCHKADAINLVEFSAASMDQGMAVSITIPFKVCGKCGHSAAQAALSAVAMHISALRKG